MRLLDELRSLRRPSGPPPGPRLHVGDRSPPLEGEPPTGPAVVAFLRHVGCPFAEMTVMQLRRVSQERPDIAWWLVSIGTRESTEAWLQTIGRPTGVRLVADPSLEHHARWGLTADDVGFFLRPRVLLEAVALRSRGIRNRPPDGTRWQQSGTFALGQDGRVVWLHYPRSAEDLPDLREAIATLDR